MSTRKLIPQHVPALRVGELVRLPTGRPALVQAVDPAQGQVQVKALTWTAEFKPVHLRRADPQEFGFAAVFLPELGAEESGEPGGEE
jgi:hypothetical protein